jgi:succinyl-CoA synthetase beta subunit
VAFDTTTSGLALLFSAAGGVEVEAGTSHLVRIPVSVAERAEVTPEWVAARMIETLPPDDVALLPTDVLQDCARILVVLLQAAIENDLELFEINPLIAVDGALVAADAKVTMDEYAAFRHPEHLTKVARPVPSELEQRARDAALQFVDLDGEICLMANGAGLNLSLLDAVAAFGSTPANFLDTGGGANTKKAYEGMRILQDRSARDENVRARLVMLSLAITRAREAADGIAKAMMERPDDPVPTFAVVHGTGSEEGREILKAAGITVAPDIRTAVEWAATAERRA